MYKINYDVAKNRLNGVLQGFLTEEEAKKYNAELKKAVDQAKSGFTAMFDLRELKVLPPEAMEVITEGKKYAARKGLKKSAMVVSSAILKMQANRSLKDIGEGEEVYFDSLIDAENFLSK